MARIGSGGLFKKEWNKTQWLTLLSTGVILLGSLFIIGRYNFLLFHSFAEFFSIAIAWSLFIIALNTKEITENGALVFLGGVYLFVGFIDMLHTISYKGMGVLTTEWEANLPTQLWIIGRYIESVTLLLYPTLLKRKIPFVVTVAVYFLITATLLSSIFVWPVFPVCYIEGVGLTPFKIISEYIICGILFGSLLLLYRKRTEVEPKVFRFMVVAILFTIGGELAFTFYVGVYDFSNLVGHFFKIVSYFFIYLALIQSCLKTPYTTLFRSLKESEQRYLDIFQNSQVGLFRIRITDNHLTAINKHCCTLLGYSDIEACIQDFKNSPNHAIQGFYKILKRDLSKEKAATIVEANFKQKDGSIGWVSLSGTYCVTKEHINGALVDISDRKHHELVQSAHLRLVNLSMQYQVRELLREFLNEAERLTASEIGFFHFIEEDQEKISLQVWSTNTQKTACNMIPNTSHYPISEAGVWADSARLKKTIIHNDYANLSHKKGLPKDHTSVNRILVVPVFRSEKVVAILGVGNKSNFYNDEDVKTVQTLADSAWEIIERKRAEEELQQAYEQMEQMVSDRTAKLRNTLTELEHSNEELSQFAHVASHDLQEPLRAVVGFLQLLERDNKENLSEKGKHYIDRTIKAAFRMQTLVNDLLTLSKINAKGCEFEEIDLNDLVTKAKKHFDSLIDEKNAVIKSVELPVITANKKQISTLFVNLISNALKYNDSMQPKVEIGVKDEESDFCFFIKDNGIGIDEQFFNRIFVVFQRLHSRHEYSGTGIGLTLCKKIVERHRGRIWVESIEGEGATFYFILPKRMDVC